MKTNLAVDEKLQLVNDEELVDALNSGLRETLGRPCEVAECERRFSDYYSSYVMEEIDLVLNDGTSIELIFKNLSRDGMLEGATRNKPYFLYNPMREIESYRVVLATHPLGTAKFYGAHTDPGPEQFWLFIERVPGTLLWQFGEDEVWQHVATWLRRMHNDFSFEIESGKPAHPPHLKVFDAEYYWQWMQRAQAFLYRTVAVNGGHSVCSVDSLAERFQAVVDRLMQLPVTLIHGEFYPSNILVQKNGEISRVCPVDWETAALGPGLIDLAALTSGGWSEEQRIAMAMAYYHEANGKAALSRPVGEFLLDLDFSNLFLAIQWLGWSPNWTPPPEHAQNWLTEACRLARKLQL